MRDLLLQRLGWLGYAAALAAVGVVVLSVALRLVERRYGPLAATARRVHIRTDLTYLLVSPITDSLRSLVTTLGIAICALLLGQRVAPDVLHGFGPVTHQPRWMIVVEMIVLGDFIYYWAHRMAHAVPCLWRFHAIHHSTEHLGWTSALRAHPVEVYVHLLNTVPLFLLGFPIDAVAPIAPLFTLYGVWIHSERDVSMRSVSYLVNSPRYHRWHHAHEDDRATNFAGLFPIFDAMFGTYRLPDHAPATLGTDDPRMPATFLQQLTYPFRSEPQRAHASDGAPIAHEQPQHS